MGPRKKIIIPAAIGAAVIAAVCLGIFLRQAGGETPERYLQEGLAAYRELDFGRAVKAFRAALNADPRNADAYYYLGQVFEASGRVEEAMEAYRQALKADPGLAAARYNLAALYAMRKSPEMAEKELRAAVEAAPRFAPAWFRLAELYYGRGSWEAAAKAYEQAAGLAEAQVDWPLLYLHLGDAYYRLGREEEAVSAWKKAKEMGKTPDLVNQALERLQKAGRAGDGT